MKNTFHAVTYALFAFVMIGSFVLIYFQNIDGVLVRKPFTMSSDPMHLKTDKAVYHKGDQISLQFSICKNRQYQTLTTWRLINETVVTFPSTGSKIAALGCFEDKWFPVGVVPPDAIPGTHHMDGSSAVILNGLHTIYYNFRSEDFQVE